MGYTYMISITDDRYICQEECEHQDCAFWKDFLPKAKCKICKEKITEDQAYYGGKLGDLQHATCLSQ